MRYPKFRDGFARRDIRRQLPQGNPGDWSPRKPSGRVIPFPTRPRILIRPFFRLASPFLRKAFFVLDLFETYQPIDPWTDAAPQVIPPDWEGCGVWSGGEHSNTGILHADWGPDYECGGPLELQGEQYFNRSTGPEQLLSPPYSGYLFWEYVSAHPNPLVQLDLYRMTGVWEQNPFHPEFQEGPLNYNPQAPRFMAPQQWGIEDYWPSDVPVPVTSPMAMPTPRPIHGRKENSLMRQAGPLAPPRAPPRKPPPVRVKERKLRGKGKDLLKVIQALSVLTEAEDFIDALYKSLPATARSRADRTLQQKLFRLYTHAGDIDFDLALGNLAHNQVEDFLYGAGGRRAGQFYGNATGSVVGPTAGPFDDAVNDALLDGKESPIDVLFDFLDIQYGANPRT